MLEAPVRYRIADLLTNSLIETRTLRRRTDRADRSRSATAWSRWPRSPHGSMPTSWLSLLPTDRHSFSRCQWVIKSRLRRQQPLPLQPAKLLSEEVSQIKYYRRNFKFFSCSPFTFLTLGAVRWDTAAYSLWIMRAIDEVIAIWCVAPRICEEAEYRV